MDGKVLLLFIAVIAVGMFVLPSTMALYTGQHDFVDGGNVTCSKCHAAGKDQIAVELMNGSAHEGMDCGGCHGPAGNLVDVTGYGGTAENVTGHAAGVGINCIGCHSGPSPVTTTDGAVNVSAELSLSTAAHKSLKFNTSANGGMNDKDMVCVACHTRVNVDLVNVSLTPDSGNITVEGGGDGNWMYTNGD